MDHRYTTGLTQAPPKPRPASRSAGFRQTWSAPLAAQRWDNARAESFWATTKVEFYSRYLWPTKAAPKRVAGDWIERIYNRRDVGEPLREQFHERVVVDAVAHQMVFPWRGYHRGS